MLALISSILYQISLVERAMDWELRKLLFGLDQSHPGATLISLSYMWLWPCFKLSPLKYKPKSVSFRQPICRMGCIFLSYVLHKVKTICDCALK